MDWLQHMRDRLRSSLWFVPALLVTLAVAAALVLTRIDRSLGTSPAWASLQVSFAGGPESARSILESIATSMLTMTGLVFSITILVLELASSQFTPRSLRSFLRDRPSKLALGVFLSTYAFAIVALREVRSEGPERAEFVPGFTVTAAFLFVLLSIGMFVYYVHHVSQRIRVASITASAAAETRRLIEKLYVEDSGQRSGPPLPSDGGRDVGAERSGYVVNAALDRLTARARHSGAVIELVAPLGSFVAEGMPVLRVHGPRLDGEDDLGSLVTLEEERTLEQDVAYGFRELVDIAIRALSPGVNDPTTAVNVIDWLHALLRLVGSAAAPDGARYDEDGELLLLVPVMPFQEYLILAVREIAHYGRDAPHVRDRLTSMLRDLAESVREEYRPYVYQTIRELPPRP